MIALVWSPVSLKCSFNGIAHVPAEAGWDSQVHNVFVRRGVQLAWWRRLLAIKAMNDDVTMKATVM